MTDPGRREHYGLFYGLRALPPADLPLVMVLGNCQAEALRVCLESTDTAPTVTTVRVPPVHELVDADVPHLQRLAARVDVLVAQPVRAGYHGLPVGTDEVAALLGEAGLLVRVPSVHYEGLYPFQVTLHVDGVPDPPVVPYHDLRSVAATAGLTGGPADLTVEERLTAYRQVAQASLAELRRREEQHDTVPVSDVVAAAGADACWTVNHPGNRVLLALADRVRERLGLPGRSVDPGRVLLRSVLTPLLPEVLEALDLPAEATRAGWSVDGATVSDTDVAAEHAAHYARHPEAVEAGLERHGDRLRELGWSV